MSDAKDKVIREAVGVLLLAFTGLLVISLATYTPVDSWNTEAAKIANYAGLIGAFIAKWLFVVLGITAYLVPLFCLAFAIGGFRHSRPAFSWFRLSGGVLFVIACASMSAVCFDAPLTIGDIEFSAPGGWIGNLISHDVLLPYLNTGGSYLIIITLLIISLMLATDLSWSKFYAFLEKLGSYLLALKNAAYKPSGIESKKRPRLKGHTPRASSPITKISKALNPK